jgi:hypothetical protein
LLPLTFLLETVKYSDDEEEEEREEEESNGKEELDSSDSEVSDETIEMLEDLWSGDVYPTTFINRPSSP